MTSASASKTAFFQREVASRFGLVPNFYSSAPDAPEITERLWAFAKAGYPDNPIPSLLLKNSLQIVSASFSYRSCIRRAQSRRCVAQRGCPGPRDCCRT
jgi:hypothetical protein